MDVVGKQNRSPATLDWLFAVALVAAVFCFYLPCWRGGFLFDDALHLLDNPVLKPGGLAKIWVPGGYINYWPLTFTAYWLEYHIWGFHTLGYHLVNLALHSLAALLVWRVLARLQVPGAMLAAAIFALHPVNVESVAWIAQLKGVLSLSLALVSVLFYLSSDQDSSRWRYGLAIVAYLLSALAKGAAVTLPVVLLACAWWQRGRIGRRDLLRVLPYVLIGVAMAGAEVWNQYFLTRGQVVRSDDIFSRAAIAGCALWFYLGKLAWPLNLSPIYPRWTIDEYSVISYLPGLMWVALLALAWWRRRTWGRPVVMLIVCYSVLLLPVLGFVNISFMRYSFVADHWQYVATIVPCAVFAGVGATLLRRFLLRPAALMVGIGASAALLVVLAVLSLSQAGIYRSDEAFYEATIARNPDSWLAQNNLGNALLDRGQVGPAIARYEKALALKADYADAHNNLAAALLRRGQIDSAIEEFKTALEIKPGYADARHNLAAATLGRGPVDVAIAHYEKALEINPDDADIQNNLAVALLGVGKVDSAIAHFEKALAINPNYADAHCNLGTALARRGQMDSAIAHYEKALEINPDHAAAHYNLGNALLGRGQVASAIAHYEKALALNPDYFEAHSNLATALAGRGDLDAAIAHYQRVLEIKPGFEVARRNLGIVQSKREQLQKALAEQLAAVRSKPNDAALLNDVAWTLATNSNASVRNGAAAIEFAERAAKISGDDKPNILNTLAAAYAETGRFPDAVRTGEQAERLAAAAGDRALAEQIHSRLDLYRGGKPYRQPPSH